MLGERSVQDRTSRGNKLKRHEILKIMLIKILGGRRGQRLSLEVAPQDGPAGLPSPGTVTRVPEATRAPVATSTV